jgi:hypothetical protein
LTAFCGLSQKFGAVWLLDDSEISRSLATFALRQPELVGKSAVNVHAQVRRVDDLREPRIGRAGDLAHVGEDVLARSRRSSRRWPSARSPARRSPPADRNSALAWRCPGLEEAYELRQPLGELQAQRRMYSSVGACPALERDEDLAVGGLISVPSLSERLIELFGMPSC